MAHKIDTLIAELGAALEDVFPEGSDNPADIQTPAGTTLTVLRKEAYEKLYADALAWRAFNRGPVPTASPQEVMDMFGKPE